MHLPATLKLCFASCRTRWQIATTCLLIISLFQVIIHLQFKRKHRGKRYSFIPSITPTIAFANNVATIGCANLSINGSFAATLRQ
jgi:hypothetical protein